MMNKISKKIIKITTILLISSFCFFVFQSDVKSQDIWVTDYGHISVSESGVGQDSGKWTWEKVVDELQKQLKKVFAQTFHQAFRAMLQTVAYDTATWLGSGAKGEGPMFIREGWGEYLGNVVDNAAGDFIYQLGQNNGFVEFDMCEPEPFLKAKIGLGLTRYARQEFKGKCTFMQMKNNWEQALDSETFLRDFQSMFEPGGNEISIVFNSYGKLFEKMFEEETVEKMERIETGGWLNVETLAGWKKNYPGQQATKANIPTDLFSNQAFQYTEDGLIDAANIFINQLLLSLIQNLMGNIGGSSYTTPYDWSEVEGLFDPEADTYNKGVAGAEEQFREIIQPKFNTRGDYSILAELSICSDPSHAGPTNCVISDKFKQAIQERITIAEAIEKGYLNPDAIFGFKADGLEPSYMEAYPYRSMLILRKFRIIPVGWEVAAQYIKDNMGATDTTEKGVKTLDQVLICFSPDDQYKDEEYDDCADTELRGKVDPNWVLKAPENYCKREGAGGFLVYKSVLGEKDKSELSINRETTYCADEQACIQEYDDGSCEAYGYCTKEDRSWSFGAESCKDRFHSCDNFKSKDGKSAFYLRSTLDYGEVNDESSGCNENNVGCLDYCEDYDVVSGKFTCSIDNGNKLHLDDDAKDCTENEEGCHEFIRIENSKANLVDLSNEDGNCTANDEALFGNCITDASSGLEDALELQDNSFLEGNIMTFSLYVKNCANSAKISLGSDVADDATANIYADIDQSKWTRLSVVHYFESGSNVQFELKHFNSLENAEDPDVGAIVADGCMVDGIKLEVGHEASAFSEYGKDALVYQKLLPKYMENDCYEMPYGSDTDYTLKDDAHNTCNDFVRRCNRDEQGCKLYTSQDDNMTIPAKVGAFDYCNGECVGYDDYLQTASFFESEKFSFFIPEKAGVCNIEAVGCSEFTNLDKIDQSAEAIEYYSELQQCTIDSKENPNPDCTIFYTWEGSDESGNQLKVHKLKMNESKTDLALTEDDSSLCNEDIFFLPATDPAYNYNCREYYSADGAVFYHDYKKTITCSDDCHPYRKTDYNIVKDISGLDINSSGCVAGQNGISASADSESIHYDSDDEKCIFCKNGGKWDDAQQACIYMAIPGQGKICSANQNKCQEYTGNNGNNIGIILNDDFEDGINFWSSQDSCTVENSSESILIDEKSLSLDVNDSCNYLNKKVSVQNSKTYALSFLIKADDESAISLDKISFKNKKNDTVTEYAFFTNNRKIDLANGTVALSKKWERFEFIATQVPKDFVADGDDIYLSFDFSNSAKVYIDNIRLTEIADRYYLIKDSWNTPEACFQDIIGRPVNEIYNIGCEAYSDQEGEIHNLRKFSRLCEESSVGCELMIDTYNYNDKNGKSWNPSGIECAADDVDCEEVKGNSYAYVVYDTKKQCNESSKGCQKLGVPNTYENGESAKVIYREVYKNNNPREYDEPNGILCNASEVGCQKWSSSDGNEFFKDPGYNVCQWGWDGSEYTWYSQVKKCSGDNSFCLSNSDCDTGNCVLGDKDPCVINTDNSMCGDVEQPGEKMVGLCPSSAEGCREYAYQETSGDTSIDLVEDSTCEADVAYGCNYRIKDEVESCSSQRDNECEQFMHQEFASEKICSEELLKVRPDRKCVEWLACQTFVESTKDEKECYDIGICTEIDLDTGLCIDFNSEKSEEGENGDDNQNLDVVMNDVYNVDDDLNKTGYSLVGYNDSYAYYPLGKMEQVGEYVEFPNGSFEVSGENGYPIGWKVVKAGNPNYSWDANDIFVIDNPVEAEEEGIKYPIDGDNILRFAPESGQLESDYINVLSDTDYALSFYINTVNLISNDSTVMIGIYSDEGSASAGVGVSHCHNCLDTCSGSGNTCMAQYVLNSQDWDKKEFYFTTESNTKKIKVVLVGVSKKGNEGALCAIDDDADCLGNIYVDDFKMYPQIKTKQKQITSAEGVVKIEETLSNECRLYPKDDALSCEYREDSGIIQKGWPGYCLQYDRSPGDPNSCLLWYPIDRVRGDGYDEGAGYSDRYPLYYCLESTIENVNVEELPITNYFYMSVDQSAVIGGDSSKDADAWFYPKEDMFFYPVDYSLKTNNSFCAYVAEGTDKTVEGFAKDFFEEWVKIIADDNVNTNVYKYHSFELASAINGGYGRHDEVGCTCDSSNGGDITGTCDREGTIFVYKVNITSSSYCTKMVEVVNATGQNKYWSGRVYQGSVFETSCNEDGPLSDLEKYATCKYTSDYQPFGAIVPPEIGNPSISFNPYEWDGVEKVDGYQPLAYIFKNNVDFNQNSDFGEARMGQKYKIGQGSSLRMNNGKIADLRGLFAQSYTNWEWTGGVCYGGSKHGDDCKFDKECLDETVSAYNSSGFKSAGFVVEINNAMNNMISNYNPSSNNTNNNTNITNNTNEGNGIVINNDSENIPAIGYCKGARYRRVFDADNSWNIPLASCGTSRSSDSGYCYVEPKITNCFLIKSNNGFTNLAFYADIDEQQLPLVRYSVDWKDDSKTIVSGVELHDRVIGDNLFSLFHYYIDNENSYLPEIEIVDNWGRTDKYVCNNFVESLPGDPYEAIDIPDNLNIDNNGNNNNEVSEKITSCQELQNIKNNLSGNYVLDADIDCSGFDFAAIGDEVTISNGYVDNAESVNFTGILDGQGHTISNLTIDLSSQDYVALFRVIGSSGIVKNIQFENTDIMGNNRVAIVTGYNFGTIENIYTDSNSSVSGEKVVGGIAAYNQGTIKNIANHANISGTDVLGGIAGLNTSKIEYVYNTGTITGDTDVGGIIGDDDNGSITEAYCLAANCYGSDSAHSGITSISDEDYFYDSQNSPMSHWNFDTIWEESSNNHPGLKVIESSGDDGNTADYILLADDYNGSGVDTLEALESAIGVDAITVIAENGKKYYFFKDNNTEDEYWGFDENFNFLTSDLPSELLELSLESNSAGDTIDMRSGDQNDNLCGNGILDAFEKCDKDINYENGVCNADCGLLDCFVGYQYNESSHDCIAD